MGKIAALGVLWVRTFCLSADEGRLPPAFGLEPSHPSYSACTVSSQNGKARTCVCVCVCRSAELERDSRCARHRARASRSRG